MEDLVDYSQDKLREIKRDIQELKRIPAKYAYIFEKMIALQEYTINTVKKSHHLNSPKKSRNTMKNSQRRKST